MQRFQFPLEQALKWRVTRLDVENAKLARLRQENARARQTHAAICESARSEARRFQAEERQTTGADLERMALYRQGIVARLKRLESEIRTRGREIEKQQAVVLDADREKRLLESLKQRQFEEWTYEMNREIENTAGELFLANRWRRARE